MSHEKHEKGVKVACPGCLKVITLDCPECMGMLRYDVECPMCGGAIIVERVVYMTCDRCGAKTATEDRAMIRREGNAPTLAQRLEFWKPKPYMKRRDYDLCEHCAASFEKWVTAATAGGGQ